MLSSAQDLLTLCLRPNRVPREAYLDFALRLVEASRGVAFLWLLDHSKHALRLGHCASVGIPKDRLLDAAGGRRLVIPPDSSSPADGLVSFRQHAWISDLFAAPRQPLHEVVLSVRSLSKAASNQEGILGYMHLIIEPTDGVQTNHPLLQSLVDHLADSVELNRRSRLPGLLRELRRRATELRRSSEMGFDTDGYLVHAAEVLKQRFGDAEMCVFFRQVHDPDRHLRAVAVFPPVIDPSHLVARRDSLLRQKILQECATVRVLDFSDQAERQEAFGTPLYDERLVTQIQSGLGHGISSILAAPVADPADKPHALAAVLLINPTTRLSRMFSRTDQEVLTEACEYLGTSIRNNETTKAMARISSTALQFRHDDPASHREIFSFLCASLPSVSGAVIAFHPRDGAEIIHLGGDMPPEVGATACRGPADAAPPPVIHREPIKGLTFRQADLIVVSQQQLADYERLVVRFLAAWLAHALRAAEATRKGLEEIVEIRHLIRSGLNAMNYIHAALARFDRYRRRRQTDIIDNPMFLEDLQWAAYAHRKTRVLIEEARFLLAGIRPENLKLGTLALQDIIADNRRTLLPDAERRGITLDAVKIRPSPEFSLAQGDRDMLDILVFNLLDNAVKYSFRHRTVHIRLQVDKDEWVLQVENDGVLIRPEDREVIFDPFTRRATGHAANSRPGTGLGLTVARAICVAHGGDVTAKSTPLGGRDAAAKTIFETRIPLRPPTATT